MWLLNTGTLRLERFYKDFPKYAILSHRWIESQEATFGDLVESSDQLTGHHKIRRFCKKARDEGYGYVWADTCCVDQKSSAELGEAINSMYKWYAQADVCYVYLADVDDGVDLEKSVWFSRGWTLQELLAPTNLLFFDCGWRLIASRQELAQRIQKITSIPEKALQRFNPGDYCVALKMSWAAERKTTREEDLAYCLLGIFDVNMPLLYGEGSKAFQRLQEEIMKSSTDSTLFLWQGRCCTSFGMLAEDPSCFSSIPDCLYSDYLQMIGKVPGGWTYNNAGMTIKGAVAPLLLSEDGGAIFVLYLQSLSLAGTPSVGIFVQKVRATDRSYRRVAVDDQMWTSNQHTIQWNLFRSRIFSPGPHDLFITRDPVTGHCSRGTCSITVDFFFDRRFICSARGPRPTDEPDNLLKDWPNLVTAQRKRLQCVFEADRTTAVGLLGHMVLQVAEELDVLICLGLDDSFRPFCIIVPFCQRIYARLSVYALLRVYENLFGKDEDVHRAFDPYLHVVALRGKGVDLQFSPEGGIELIVYGGSNSSEYIVSMTFHADDFLEQYLPGDATSRLDEHGRFPEDDRRKLVEKDSAIFHSRRPDSWLLY